MEEKLPSTPSFTGRLRTNTPLVALKISRLVSEPATETDISHHKSQHGNSCLSDSGLFFFSVLLPESVEAFHRVPDLDRLFDTYVLPLANSSSTHVLHCQYYVMSYYVTLTICSYLSLSLKGDWCYWGRHRSTTGRNLRDVQPDFPFQLTLRFLKRFFL